MGAVALVVVVAAGAGLVADLTDSVTAGTGPDRVTGSDAGSREDTGAGVELTGTGEGGSFALTSVENGSVALTSTGPRLASMLPGGVAPTPTPPTDTPKDPHAAAVSAKKHTSTDTQNQIGLRCLRAAMRGGLNLNIPIHCLPTIAAFMHANCAVPARGPLQRASRQSRVARPTRGCFAAARGQGVDLESAARGLESANSVYGVTTAAPISGVARDTASAAGRRPRAAPTSRGQRSPVTTRTRTSLATRSPSAGDIVSSNHPTDSGDRMIGVHGKRAGRVVPQLEDTKHRFMSARFGLLAIAISVVFLVAGCGSSSSKSTSTTGAAVSESAFIAQAKAIMCPLTSKVEALPKPNGISELVSYAEQVRSLLHEARSKLGALVPPQNKAAAFAKGLSVTDEGTKEIEEVAQAARAGDVQRVQALGSQLSSLSGRIDAIGRELGGGECP